MGLFDRQVTWVHDYLARGLDAGRIVELDAVASWPEVRSFVLARDTALELGRPAEGSVSTLLWSADAPPEPAADRVLLEGPSLTDLMAQGQTVVPFGQVVVVYGAPPDDYEGYLALKEALFDVALEGVSLRAAPSQGHLWCRIHTDALAAGFHLGVLGGTLVAGLRQLDHVRGVRVLLHTAGRSALAPLAGLAADATHVVGALIKRHEEEHAECEECEYADVCDEREHRPRQEAS